MTAGRDPCAGHSTHCRRGKPVGWPSRCTVNSRPERGPEGDPSPLSIISRAVIQFPPNNLSEEKVVIEQPHSAKAKSD